MAVGRWERPAMDANDSTHAGQRSQHTPVITQSAFGEITRTERIRSRNPRRVTRSIPVPGPINSPRATTVPRGPMPSKST